MVLFFVCLASNIFLPGWHLAGVNQSKGWLKCRARHFPRAFSFLRHFKGPMNHGRLEFIQAMKNMKALRQVLYKGYARYIDIQKYTILESLEHGIHFSILNIESAGIFRSKIRSSISLPFFSHNTQHTFNFIEMINMPLFSYINTKGA